jgi:protease-4
MSLALASAILRGTWLLDPNVAQNQLPIIEGILNGSTRFEPMSEDEKLKFNPEVFGVVGIAGAGKIVPEASLVSVGTNSPGVNKPKMVKVIPIVGVMLKYSEDCGPIGMVEIAKRVSQASSDPQIDAIVLSIDSPGGMVEGTQTLVDAIKASEKPVVAFVNDGMACSAGYWIASSASEIFASQETDYVGSIGVYVTIADYKKAYEAKGIPIHQIYADQSSEKNKHYKDAIEGNYDSIKKGMLNPIADKFINSVKANRAGKLNAEKGDPFKGDVFMAKRAIEIGLVDKIGSLNDAILRAAELSSITSSETGATIQASNQNSDMKIKLLASQTLLAGVLGVSFAQGETEVEHELTPENIASVENALVTASNQLAQANTDLQAAQGELTTANAEVERLGKQAGTVTADPKVEKIEGNSSTTKVELSDTDHELATLKAKMGIK